VRIDLVLHNLCLFKTRSQASRACAEGRVWLNGSVVRSSHVVRAGDRIRWIDPLGRVEREIELLEIPAGQLSKTDARSYVREIARRVVDDPWVRG
jgi:ribosomal 50S subunit-recycling heat shock protein